MGPRPGQAVTGPADARQRAGRFPAWSCESSHLRFTWRSRSSRTCGGGCVATRWPEPAPGPPWSQGTDLDYLRALTGYWVDGFDWRRQETPAQRVRPLHGRDRWGDGAFRAPALGQAAAGPHARLAQLLRRDASARRSTRGPLRSRRAVPAGLRLLVASPEGRSGPRVRRAPVAPAHAGAWVRAVRRVWRRLRRRRRDVHGADGAVAHGRHPSEHGRGEPVPGAGLGTAHAGRERLP